MGSEKSSTLKSPWSPANPSSLPGSTQGTDLIQMSKDSTEPVASAGLLECMKEAVGEATS